MMFSTCLPSQRALSTNVPPSQSPMSSLPSQPALLQSPVICYIPTGTIEPYLIQSSSIPSQLTSTFPVFDHMQFTEGTTYNSDVPPGQ